MSSQPVHTVRLVNNHSHENSLRQRTHLAISDPRRGGFQTRPWSPALALTRPAPVAFLPSDPTPFSSHLHPIVVPVATGMGDSSEHSPDNPNPVVPGETRYPRWGTEVGTLDIDNSQPTGAHTTTDLPDLIRYPRWGAGRGARWGGVLLHGKPDRATAVRGFRPRCDKIIGKE